MSPSDLSMMTIQNYAGEAVRSITIAGTKMEKTEKRKKEETKTIKVGGLKTVKRL